jgi:hypothetical protein
MPWPDRLTPTAVLLVSRAWVVDEVASRGVDPQRQAVLVDELAVYEPPRRHGLRNTVIFWLVVVAAAGLASAIGLPKWTGFAVALLFFVWVARELAVRALRWRLDQLLADTQR